MDADGVDPGGSDSDLHSEPDVDDDADKDEHSDKEGKDGIHWCSKFSKTHRGKSNLDAHMSIHAGGLFKCSFCGRKLNNRQALLCHLKSHTVHRPISCTVCSQQFMHNASLKHHMKIHKCTGESSDLHNYEREVTLGYPKAGETFSSWYSKQIHKKTHLAKDAFTCTECGRCFRFISQLKLHRIKHTREKQFGCSVCKSTFRWPTQVKIHKCYKTSPHGGIYNPEKTFICPKCGETFSTGSLLIVHMKIHRKTFSCTECKMQFNFRSQFRRHMRKHKEEKLYNSPRFLEKFSQTEIAKQYMFARSKEKPFSCNDCGKRFSWRFQVKRHTCSYENMNKIETRYSDTVSEEGTDGDLTTLRYNMFNVSDVTEDGDKDFWTETRQHQSGVTYQRTKRHFLSEKGHVSTKNPLNSFVDTLCEPKNADSVDFKFSKQGKSLKSELSVQVNGKASISDTSSDSDETERSEESHTLQKHLRCCVGEKTFSCTVCGERFVTGGHLSIHTSVHTGEMLLSCVVCKRSFGLQSDLVSHDCALESLQCYQSQTKEQMAANKLFRCPHCDEEFALKRQMQMHMRRRHTIKKNFRCSVCNESFSRGEDLTSHTRSHMRCSVCNAVFSNKDSLVLHMRSHTLQTQFHCMVCDQEFAWRRHLIKHMEIHKNENMDSAREQDDINCPQCFSRSEGNSFSCPVCKACFSDKELFDQHTTMHTRSTRLCDNSTDKRQLLKQSPAQENIHCICCSEFSCQHEGTYHGVKQSSNPDGDLQPKIETETSDSSDSDTDDSDFWQETRTHESGDKSGKRKVLESGLEFKRDKASEYFTVSGSESKTAVQHFLYTEGLTQHNTFHTESQKEVKQEDVTRPGIKEEKEETAITNFTFSPVPGKTEDEMKPPCSPHHYSHTEVGRDSLRQPEAAKNSDQTFGPESFKSAEISDFWKETRESHSGLQSEKDDCKDALSGSDNKAAESLQPESDDSVDSDFWKANRIPQAAVDSKTNDRQVRNDSKHKPYSCSECGKRCLHLSHYKRHMNLHMEKRGFLCSICGNEFLYKSILKTHIRSHTGEKPFSCSVCGKKYAQKAGMRAHMVVHAVENPYSCDVCYKSFGWYTELKYHQCVGESLHK